MLQLNIYKTIATKECTRFFRIWTQTLLPPVINQSLYFIIFGTFIGSQIPDISGISYLQFIVPGLLLMAVINSSYSNVVSSFFGSKFQRSIEELLISPASPKTIIFGYSSGGILRGLIVGLLVYLVSLFFTQFQVENLVAVLAFSFMTAFLFSLMGLLNGIFAKKFDDISIIPTFILTPLSYFGGIFYTLDSLDGVFLKLSYLNPIVYMIDGFRYGFYGMNHFPVTKSAAVVISLIVVLYLVNFKLIKSGYGLRS